MLFYNCIGKPVSIDFSEHYYYDSTSPSGIRRKQDWLSGKNYHILKAHAGDVAGFLRIDRCKYYIVKTGNISTHTHRVVWILHNGEIPKGFQIDHIDGDSLNNKIENLRCVANVTNARNQKSRNTNTSSVCGVGLLINKKVNGENHYWKAQWNDLSGKRMAKCFSIALLGNEEAFRLACEYRAKMIEELNAQGAGYTDTHGKRQ